MQVRSGYRLTELGLIPCEWSVLPLKRISPSQSVGLVINPSTYVDSRGTVPMLLGSDIQPNIINFENSRKITESSNRKIPASQLKAGDLVMVRVGEPGITAVIPPEIDGCNCASMMIVRKGPNFDSNWLCHLMNSDLGLSQVHGVQYGTAQKQFNISDAIDFLYPTPPLVEQRAIAKALSDVDALIAGLEKLVAKKRDLKQAAMQQLLTGQTRLPGFSGEWEARRLGDLADVLKGRGLSKGHLVSSGMNSCILYGELFTTYDRVINSVVSKTNSPEGLPGLNGDVLLPGSTTTKGIDLAVASALQVNNVQLGGDINVIRMKHASSYDPVFMANLLTHTQKHAIADLAQGTTIIHLYGRSLLNLTLKLPVISEQIAIATDLSSMNAEIAAFETRIAKTRKLKQGMMQELLTGRTRLV